MRTWKMLVATALVAAVLLPALRTTPAGAQGGAKRLILALEEDPPLVNPAITSIIQSWYVGCAGDYDNVRCVIDVSASRSDPVRAHRRHHARETGTTDGERDRRAGGAVA